MKQLKVRVKDNTGYDWGMKKVISAHWNAQGELETLVVNFMESENSNDYSAFNKQGDEYINRAGNLIAKIIDNE